MDVIGYGGMGVVYRARDNAIGRHVALKVMGTTFAYQPELRERFLREARAAGNLQHLNIVVIYDLGEHEGAPYIAMEYLAGHPLDKALASGSLGVSERLRVLAQVCDGLQFAHDSGVIHRDIKPANVILLSNGTAKLVDFGIARTADAKLTKTGMIVGTVAYMAPEQLKGRPIDARTDVFAAGVMLYEMLAGKLPFEGESTAETMMQILQDEPPELRPEGVLPPAELAALVGRALRKDPAERYQTAREFGDAVRGYLRAQERSVANAATVVRSRPELEEPRRVAGISASASGEETDRGLAVTRPAYIPPTMDAPPTLRRERAEPAQPESTLASGDIHQPRSSGSLFRRWGAVAAGLLVAAFVGGYLLLSSGHRGGNDIAATGSPVSMQVRAVEDGPLGRAGSGPLDKVAGPNSTRVYFKGPGWWFILKNDSIVDQSDIAHAEASTGADGPQLSITFNATGAAKMREASAANVGRGMAVLIDGELVEVGGMNSRSDGVVVSGIAQPRAEDLAKRINQGVGAAKPQVASGRGAERPSADTPSTGTPSTGTPSASVVTTEPKKTDPVPVKVAAVPVRPPLPHSTPSGVTYWDTKEGTGAVATKGKTLTVSYRGHLTDGTPFDVAHAGKPFEFPLGKGYMIKGWEEGVEGMKVGGRRKLRVPPEAGYGAAGGGAEIPPNSTLIFDIELLKVK